MLDWAAGGEGDEAMIVGHAPDVETLVAELVTSGELNLAFKKSAVCCIRFEAEPGPGTGRLEWLIPPKVFRLMKGRTVENIPGQISAAAKEKRQLKSETQNPKTETNPKSETAQ